MSDDYLICDTCRNYHHLSRWSTGMNETQHLVVERFLSEHHTHPVSVVPEWDARLDAYEEQDWWHEMYLEAKE